MRKTMVLVMMCLFLTGIICVAAIAANESASQQVKPREIKIDRNYDGIIDRTEFYDTKGVITKAESDTNEDGKVDERVYYEKGMAVKGEKDMNNDGKTDTTLFYDAKGSVTKSETDANSDGKIDEWVYYEAGKLVKAEKDTNNDGKSDTWLKY